MYQMRSINTYIVSNPDICGGELTFKGTRVMVWQVLELLAAGETIEEILEDFPTINRNHIMAALEYAKTFFQNTSLHFSKELNEVCC